MTHSQANRGKSLTARIFVSILTAVLAVLAAAVFIIYGVTFEYFNGQLEAELAREAEYVGAGTETGGADYLAKLDGGEMRITWISADGTVLYDNKTDPSQMENHSRREEFREAISSEDGKGTAVRYSSTLYERTDYCALRLSDGSVIRVSTKQYSYWALLLDMAQPILLVFTVAVAAALILAFGLTRKAVGPINAINFDKPENTEVYDELKPVIRRLVSQNRRISEQMAELEERRNEFDAITTNMSEGMLIIDNKAEVLSCNKSALDILGAESVPKRVLSFTNTDCLREAVRVSLGGSGYNETIRIDNRYYSIHAAPVLRSAEEGDVTVEGAVIVILDETEKEERESLRREFTSNVSHELKTPLTSISGFAELIENGIADGKDAERFAGNIHREATRLITLVNDIIGLSRLDTCELPNDPEPIELLGAAKAVTERLESVASEAGITLTCEGNPCFVRGNSQIIGEMIFNLCDNGIKYNKRGGNVRVTVNDCKITVADNGVGIPAECIPRIYERFYRVDKSHSREIGGTGLGLSIVKHGAMYHGAEITTESRPGKGTVITITFPQAAERPLNG